MFQNLQVEELAIDDSFINYCLGANKEDVLYWESVERDRPECAPIIDEARKIVIGLNLMLKEDYGGQVKKNDDEIDLATGATVISQRRFNYGQWLKYAAVVITLLTVFWLSYRFVNGGAVKQDNRELAQNFNGDTSSVITSGNGERKYVLLPDNTKLYLNAGSRLILGKGFGTANRSVYLFGEAMFDVTHNADLPFVVHVKDFDVKVLGTLFNVKAYEGENTATTLVRGKIELTVKKNGKKIILQPSQKLVMKSHGEILAENEAPLLDSLTYDKKNAIVETAWTQNKFEIVNETFLDIKPRMERWYKVKIRFADDVVTKYPFTATYEKESLEEVLKSLQLSYHFNYSINKDEVVISK